MASFEIKSELTGIVFDFLMEPGAEVQEGDIVMLIESMKMEAPVIAPRKGVLDRFTVEKGANVNTGEVLCILRI